MLWRFLTYSAFITLSFGMSSGAFGGVIYEESVNGDLSNVGTAPTSLGPLTVGSNQIFGITGRTSGIVDRDYFVITVPSGFALDSITVLPGTTFGGAEPVSFIGVQAGPQVTLPTTTTTAQGLLGWWHYEPADINTDILPTMCTPDLEGMGSSGCTPPLGSGDYAFWVQELSSGTFNYGFDLNLTRVPEPNTFALIFIGFAALVLVLRRRNGWLG
jgi:hypothetical protein